MKKLSVFVFTICSMVVFGQKVSDYKYISIPDKFPSFKQDNDFGLGDFLAKALKGKKYVTLQGDKDQWPSESKGDNSCNTLKADILDDSSFLRNKVVLQFKDCHDKVLQSIKASSTIKDYKEGFQDALRQTIVNVPVSNPVAIVNHVEEVKAEPVSTASSPVENTPVSTENTAKKYSNGKLNLQKVQIDGSQFILVGSESSVPYATFKATTKKDVFRVKLENGSSTIGYFENGNIVIEIPQSNGEYAKEVFSGK